MLSIVYLLGCCYVVCVVLVFLHVRVYIFLILHLKYIITERIRMMHSVKTTIVVNSEQHISFEQ